MTNELISQPGLEGFCNLKEAASPAELIFLPELQKVAEVSSLVVLDLTPNRLPGKRSLRCQLGQNTQEVAVFSDINDFMSSHSSKREIPSGIVVKVPHDFASHTLSSDETDALKRFFKVRLGKAISKGGPKSKGPRKVWFVEEGVVEPLKRDEIDVRIAFMRELGLVGFDEARPINDAQNGLEIFYSRLPKKAVHGPVDISRGEKIPYVSERGVNELLRAGFLVVDQKEMFRRLRNSRNPKSDYVSLREGSGTIVEPSSRCGCFWRIALDGSKTRIIDCDDPECPEKTGFDEIPAPEVVKPKPVYYIGNNIPFIRNGEPVVCNKGCGGHLCFDRRIKAEDPSGKVTVLSDLKCPHCGLDGRRPKHYVIKLKEYRIEEYNSHPRK